MDARIETVDHRIEAISTANSRAGEPVALFVREKQLSGTTDQPVVLLIHGGTYPALADFDLPVPGYSWMDHLATHGFHVFAMDCVGYGLSSRNWMDDHAAALDASSPGALLRSPQSDWQDMHRVVEFIRQRSGAERISLVGWSAGGPRAGGYAALHPGKIERLVLLAPAYMRDGGDVAIDEPGAAGPPLRTTNRETFEAMWDNEIRRSDQIDIAVREAVWSFLMEIDPVGASWKPPVVRSPNTSLAAINRGWNRAMAARITSPSLLISMAWDEHIEPSTVSALFDDLRVENKVHATIAGASHYLPWERDRAVLHRLSAEWLSDGSIGGLRRGTIEIDPRM